MQRTWSLWHSIIGSTNIQNYASGYGIDRNENGELFFEQHLQSYQEANRPIEELETRRNLLIFSVLHRLYVRREGISCR
jgi:hypothetical protein